MNRMKWHLWAAWMMALLVAVTSACAQTRTITVTATVKNGAGVAVANVPVALAGGTVAVERTNAAGQAVLTADIPVSRTKMLVLLTPWQKVDAYNEREADVANYKAVTNASAFKPLYELTLDPQQSTYNIDVSDQPTVKVSGRIVATQAVLKTLSLGYKWSAIDAAPSPETGNFEIRVAQGEASDIFIESSEGGEVHAIRITAQQAAADVVIGDIVVPGDRVGRKVKIQVSNFKTLRATPEVPKTGDGVACLISSDGSRVYAAGMTPSGAVGYREIGAPPLQLPPGTYYVATGGMAEFSYGMDLWRLLKAGREADVMAAGVPKLVVPNDGATTAIEWSFDATQAATALRSIK